MSFQTFKRLRARRSLDVAYFAYQGRAEPASRDSHGGVVLPLRLSPLPTNATAIPHVVPFGDRGSSGTDHGVSTAERTGVIPQRVGREGWIRDLGPLGVGALAVAGAGLGTSAGCGGADEVRLDFETDEGFGPPVQADEAGDALVEFVRYSGFGWEVAQADARGGVVCEPFVVGLPELVAVAA